MEQLIAFLSRYRWALSCVLLLIVCVLIARPYAEIGVIDDWSYIRTTQIFAQTGHLVYNGWAAPLLGWQAMLGALFIKLFGPSFTAIRASILLVAVLATLLLHRTFVRTGATEWNATIGTLTIMVSPVALPLAFTFHTDMPAAFCIILSLYCCLRALRAGSSRHQIAWLLLASTAGDLGGTNRQIAWLAALTFVPAAGWLLRRNRSVLLAAAACCAVTLGFIATSLHWLLARPHTVPEKVIMGAITPSAILHLARSLETNLLSLPFYLFPLLVAFALRFPRKNKRALAAAGCLSALLLGFYLYKQSRESIDLWLIPCSESVITRYGAFAGGVYGPYPVLLPLSLRIVLTILTLGAGVGFVAFAAGASTAPSPTATPPTGALSRTEFATLLLPFATLYFAALLPRAVFWFMLDRYLFPLYLVAALALVRFYQRKAQRQFSPAALVAALAAAALGTSLLHDAYVVQRAKLAAAAEIVAAGTPRTALSAGFEYDSWTQIMTTGYVTDFRMAKRPAGEPAGVPSAQPPLCAASYNFLTPSIHAAYLLSYQQNACLGASRFAPVTYKPWLGARSTIYIVRAKPPQPPAQ